MPHPLSGRRVGAGVAAAGAAVAIVSALTIVVPGHSTSNRVSTAAASGAPAVAPASGGGDPSTLASPPPSPNTTPAPATAAGNAAHEGAGAAPQTVATVARPAPANPATPTPTPVGAAKPAAPSGPSPAAPGTYRYHQVGSLPGTPAEGTLVVAPASAAGTQTWTRAVGGTVGPSTSVMRFDASGAYLVAPGSQAAGAASCTFAAPVPWPPWPTTPGQSVSGHATCGGGISSYQVTGNVQATAPVVVAGSTIDAAVVVYMVTLGGTVSGSPFSVTLTETDYYAPALRVPVLTRTHVSGTAIGFPITTDRTDTLESLSPS